MIIDIILFKESCIGRIFIDNVPFCFIRFDNDFKPYSNITKLVYKRNKFSSSFPFKVLTKGLVPTINDITLHFSKPNTIRLSYTLNFGWIYALRDFINITYGKNCDVSFLVL